MSYESAVQASGKVDRPTTVVDVLNKRLSTAIHRTQNITADLHYLMVQIAGVPPPASVNRGNTPQPVDTTTTAFLDSLEQALNELEATLNQFRAG